MFNICSLYYPATNVQKTGHGIMDEQWGVRPWDNISKSIGHFATPSHVGKGDVKDREEKDSETEQGFLF